MIMTNKISHCKSVRCSWTSSIVRLWNYELVQLHAVLKMKHTKYIFEIQRYTIRKSSLQCNPVINYVELHLLLSIVQSDLNCSTIIWKRFDGTSKHGPSRHAFTVIMHFNKLCEERDAVACVSWNKKFGQYLSLAGGDRRSAYVPGRIARFATRGAASRRSPSSFSYCTADYAALPQTFVIDATRGS